MNMREKMARVSARQAAEYFGVPGVNLFVETNWEDFAPDNILDVMREPSDDVVKSGVGAIGVFVYEGKNPSSEVNWIFPDHEDCIVGWQAMIDAIKSGK